MTKWYALYTRSRHEKLVSSTLEKNEIETFLPIRKIKKRWSDRMVTTEEPLFKGYVFVKMDPARKTDILKTKGAVKIVSAGINPIPIEEGVILSLKNIVQQEISIDPFPYIDKGDRIVVTSGPFRDTEGYIIHKDDKKCRIVISVSAIKSSIAIELDTRLVEKA